MTSKSRINIVSRTSPEFFSTVNVDNVPYQVQTEDRGVKSAKIVSRVYSKGEIVFSRTSDYSHLLRSKDPSARLASLMESHHKTTVDMFVKEQSAKQKLKSEYFDEVRNFLKQGQGDSALALIEEAVTKYPADPFFLSYYGCLVAVVGERPKDGIRLCTNAIKMLGNSFPVGKEFFYPAFYLNLGRAYFKGGRRKDALASFNQGLKFDPANEDLLMELQKMGLRRRTAVPFLDRGNPLNKYIGMLLAKVGKKPRISL